MSTLDLHKYLKERPNEFNPYHDQIVEGLNSFHYTPCPYRLGTKNAHAWYSGYIKTNGIGCWRDRMGLDRCESKR